uniref:I36RA protein n=1 Tax=Meleagris gallopavo TaxID=9103 RepID=A0A803XZ60_MELGA
AVTPDDEFYGAVPPGGWVLWGGDHWRLGSMGQGPLGSGVCGAVTPGLWCPLEVGFYGVVTPGCGALWCGPIRRSPHLSIPQEVKLLDLFVSKDAAIPYTFYKTFGGTTHTFEAAAFPGHFLSTAPQSDQELGLAPRAAPGSITSFYLRR